MVNASLNWASIVGIVLAIGGAGLYFMRSFKPALARDYDVFFAAIGLLCGGILFFQGWRLDPILQFGQFLLAGTTVFFAYESVRLRGVATDQARRSSYFDEPDSPRSSMGDMRGRRDDPYERFDDAPQPINRRFSSRDDFQEEESDKDLYQQRRASRAAIPEEAVSRSGRNRSSESFRSNSEQSRRMARFSNDNYRDEKRSEFGDRRNSRQEMRRGTRPSVNDQKSKRDIDFEKENFSSPNRVNNPSRRSRDSKSSSFRSKVEDASFSSSRDSSTTRRPIDSRRTSRQPRAQDGMQSQSNSRYNRSSQKDNRDRSRDNNSRFDD